MDDDLPSTQQFDVGWDARPIPDISSPEGSNNMNDYIKRFCGKQRAGVIKRNGTPPHEKFLWEKTLEIPTYRTRPKTTGVRPPSPSKARADEALKALLPFLCNTKSTAPQKGSTAATSSPKNIPAHPLASSTQIGTADTKAPSHNALMNDLSPISSTVTPPRRFQQAKDSPQWTDDEFYNDESFLRATQEVEQGAVKTPKSSRLSSARRFPNFSEGASPVLMRHKPKPQHETNYLHRPPPQNLSKKYENAGMSSRNDVQGTATATNVADFQPAVSCPKFEDELEDGDPDILLAALDTWDSKPETAAELCNPASAPTLHLQSGMEEGEADDMHHSELLATVEKQDEKPEQVGSLSKFLPFKPGQPASTKPATATVSSLKHASNQPGNSSYQPKRFCMQPVAVMSSLSSHSAQSYPPAGNMAGPASSAVSQVPSTTALPASGSSQSGTRKCTAEEIERKRQEALKKRQKSHTNLSSQLNSGSQSQTCSTMGNNSAYNRSGISLKKYNSAGPIPAAVRPGAASHPNQTTAQTPAAAASYPNQATRQAPAKYSPEDIEQKRQAALEKRRNTLMQSSFRKHPSAETITTAVPASPREESFSYSQGSSMSQLSQSRKYSPEEIEGKRRAALEKRRQKLAQPIGPVPNVGPVQSQLPSSNSNPMKCSPDEIERKRIAALEKRKNTIPRNNSADLTFSANASNTLPRPPQFVQPSVPTGSAVSATYIPRNTIQTVNLNPIGNIPSNTVEALNPVSSVPRNAAQALNPVSSIPRNAAQALNPVINVPRNAAQALNPVSNVTRNAAQALNPLINVPSNAVQAVDPHPVTRMPSGSLMNSEVECIPNTQQRKCTTEEIQRKKLEAMNRRKLRLRKN